MINSYIGDGDSRLVSHFILTIGSTAQVGIPMIYFFTFMYTRNYGGHSRQDATPLEIGLDIASVRETTGVGANLCESGVFARTYACLSDSIQFCANLCKFERIYLSLSESTQVCVNLHEFAQIYTSLCKSTRVCANIREFA